MDEHFEDWTSCEMYGHNFVDGRCLDCGESNDEEDS